MSDHGFIEPPHKSVEEKLNALIDLLLPRVPLSALSPEVRDAILALRKGDTGPVRTIIAADSGDPIGGPEHPKANGHRWPCAGFYTGNHNEAFLNSWSCTCGAGRG